jgi:hypothetical protein
MDLDRWQDRDEDSQWLRTAVAALLNDWGAFLDFELFYEAIRWTHFRCGPEGNAVSPDALVGVPNSVRWIADSRAWPKKHFDHLFAAVSAGGRLFCIFDESAAGFQVSRQLRLIARDAYNGILRWSTSSTWMLPTRSSCAKNHFVPHHFDEGVCQNDGGQNDG